MISLIHAFSEGTRLAVIITSAVRTNTYKWVLSVICSFMLNLATRTGWTRLFLMLVIHTAKSDLWHILRPSMFTRIHAQAKFQLGYVRFCAPLAIGIVRGVINGLSPLSNSSAVFAVGCAFIFELMEDCIIWHEWIPYAKPSKYLPDFFTWYRNIGRFNPHQSHTITFKSHSGSESGFGCEDAHARGLSIAPLPEEVISRPLPLHGARRLSLTMQAATMGPATTFMLCALQLFLGAGYVSGHCEDHIDDILSQALLWELPLPC